MTTTYRLIGPHQVEAFEAALRRHGWQPADFELQEDVFDPAKAEVEAALGEIGIRCLKTEAVTVYRIGSGVDWLAEFESDLSHGRIGPERSS
ncbi:MAG TPA: hypothetical protein VGP22_18815 [Albitalea sp.]|jgi:hypothetical protein|nr:hypothetical protein [Albitalea sp.]